MVRVVANCPVHGELEFLSTWRIMELGWNLKFMGDMIYAHIAPGTFYERREVYREIKIEDYYKYNRIYYHGEALWACVESALIGPGR